MSLKSVSAWAVCAYIRSDSKTLMTLSLSKKLSVHSNLKTVTKKDKKTPHDKAVSPNLKQTTHEREGSIEVVREYILRLEQAPKSLRNQGIIEAATEQALRTGEINTLRIEWLDFETGRYRLLDSKKSVMFTRVMTAKWARHLDELIRSMNQTEGILFQPYPNAPHKGRKPGSKTHGSLEGLTIEHIDRIFADCSKLAGIPTQTPRMCRAYRACIEHFVLRKPDAHIQWLLRHDNPQSLDHYLGKLCFFEDQAAMFLMGKEQPYFQSECARSFLTEERQGCPGATPDCHCRFFAPRVFPKDRGIEVTTQ